ncbi:hypothetical protein PHMEG_00020791 [Phytophthora megakarya]|uniref:DDE Tnp4 domain-containing protein n=1 Tax=Phytophthora megakarya TaxID=4795 RepID=A0A225VP62_9STRA|nr:hypothetical protein PHMEG_00020791 [Phytophthora megakarya]
MLRLPEVICTCEGVRSNPLEALGVCLRRLLYPKHWIDIAGIFGMAASTLSHIFYYVVEFLDDKLEEFLYFDVDRILKNFDIYCDAIAAKEPRSIRGVWGFIDGTVRTIADLVLGNKPFRSMKFQTVVTPDGLISQRFCPFDGRHHDMLMLNKE